MKSFHRYLIVFIGLLTLFTVVMQPSPVFSQTNIIVVTTANDDGPGSFRYALIAAESGTTIKFDPAVFPLDDPQVIYLTEELPEIYQDNLTIDASDAGVILDGSLLDITSELLIDNIEFKINDEVIFSSTFDININYWNKEDPDTWATDLAWIPEGMEGGEGSMAVTIQPDGVGYVFFYSKTPNLSWQEIEDPNSPIWQAVKPGDRVTFSYDYKGFDHVAFYHGAYETSGEIVELLNQDVWGQEEWRHKILSGIVPNGISRILPLFSLSNYQHGAALKITSDHNEIYGLAIQNFYKGFIVYGNDNRIGRVEEDMAGCSGPCNRIESAMVGIEMSGQRNVVAQNWIGLTADGEIGNVAEGVNFTGELYSVDNQLIDNWILPWKSSVSGHNQERLLIAGNWLGPALDQLDHFPTEVIRIDNAMVGVIIGPDNTIINASGSAIIGFNDSVVGMEIFGNEIVGIQGCGILLSEVIGTHIHDNWVGVLKDGTILPNYEGICLNTAENVTIGPGNHFSYNLSMAINVGDSPGTQVTANYFFKNNISALDVWGRVGDEPDTPRITAVSTATLTVVGATSPDAIVEIYYNQKSEGGDYVSSCNANKLGKFYCTIPKDQFQTDISVSALARLENGGTSSFSDSYYVATPDYSSITGITGPLSISTDPQVIGMSIAIAGLLLFSFNGLAEISSRLIKNLADQDDDEEKEGKQSGVIHRLTILNTRGKRWLFYLGWALILVLIAFAQSLLESHPLFSKAQLELTLLLLAVTAVLSLVEVGAEWITRKRWKTDCQFCSEINFRGLIFVIGSVALSRLLGFSPGVIVGMAGVVFLIPELSASRKGPASFWVLLAIFLISMVAWGLSVLFMEISPIVETMMLTLFFLGVQAVFFGLIPFGDSSGKDIFNWKKAVWGAFSLISLAVFVYMIFMPAFTDVDAMRQNDYLTIYIIGGVLALISGLLWVANKWRWFEKKKPAATVEVQDAPAETPGDDQT